MISQQAEEHCENYWNYCSSRDKQVERFQKATEYFDSEEIETTRPIKEQFVRLKEVRLLEDYRSAKLAKDQQKKNEWTKWLERRDHDESEVFYTPAVINNTHSATHSHSRS
jgi:hypothetical protein